jgi:hypothetical protein
MTIILTLLLTPRLEVEEVAAVGAEARAVELDGVLAQA